MSEDDLTDNPDTNETEKPKRASATFLSRHVLASDSHRFVGRVYDLGIISLHFDTYEALSKYPDCKYAFDIGYQVQVMVERVESLNFAGALLWPNPMPDNFGQFPVSRYDWLKASADVFLMRYISVVDCAIILVNAVYEVGLDAKKCSIANLRKARVPELVLGRLQAMQDDQGALRIERNARFHHGRERSFTQDDVSFRTASLFERLGSPMVGHDRYGRKLDLVRSFKEGLVGLQRNFNSSTRRLARHLDKLYDPLGEEFEGRFAPLIAAATHGLNAKSRVRPEG
ncbi:MAG: hypothetical protein H2042_11080 [Rhizobiales bacterium]|nr:hypothetical protein [Hyphomicrobiales bacterium]